MDKVGLVLEGGGLRGIYTGGVLDQLMEDEIWFPYVTGVSAGACNATSYISRQRGRAGRVLLEHFMDPRYLSIRNYLLHGSVFGMDFLFHTIPNQLDLFDFQAFAASNVEFEVPVTNLRTGLADYYGKRALGDENLTLLRATSSMPMVSKIVWYGGQPYLDGAVADSIPVRHALERGCRRVVVVLTRPRGYVKPAMGHPTLRSLQYHAYPNFRKATDTRHTRYNETLHFLEQLELRGDALVLAPKKPIAFSSFEKNPEKMRGLYEDGMADAREMAGRIRAFLECGET